MIDQLIRVLNQQEISDDYWWDIIGSVEKAKEIVSKAFKENPTTTELIALCNLIDIEDDNENISNIELYNKCLNELRRELILIES